ncbi:MAG: beta-galactosidase trimerization domain-containing protein [Lentisphaeria bacterium]|nr:beta-galactosidase trimerization domain-containing protein [Lentisphaeria bacterium]
MSLKIKYALFYDFHTSSLIPDLGKDFDVERFTDNLLACGVDFITWHARCNQGNAYYDTACGYKHPGLTYDLFGEILRSCKAKGIRVSAYFNGALSDEELIRHRDWMRIAPDGRSISENRISPYMRCTCYNSPFREHLKNMVRELAQTLAPDGFFFDCMSKQLTCICPYCMREMQARGIDYNKRSELEAFTGESVLRLAKELHALIKDILPQAMFFLNGGMVEEMQGYNSHFESESLPTVPGLGYDFLPVQAHYLRNVAQGAPVLNMPARFYDWGDFGGLRKEEALEFDLFYGLANGMRPNVGGHWHPRGDADQPVFDLLKKVYNNMQQYDQWCDEASNKPEIGVVFTQSEENVLRSNQELRAAVRMLSELKYQFDVLTEGADWEGYKILLLPDKILLSEQSQARLQKHLDQGGRIIASGESGLDLQRQGFVLPAWPVEYRGASGIDPVYFESTGPFAQGLPEMPLSLYAQALAVRLKPGAELSMEIIKPYMNRGFDGLRSHFYTPPQEKSGLPFLALNPQVAYFSGRIFAGYFERSPYQLRLLLGNVIEHFHPRPMLRAPGLPSFARAFVQQNGNMRLLHILAYAPELRGNAVALEDRATLVNQELALRIDADEVKCVYLAPHRQELEFRLEDGYCHFTLAQMQGYALIVVEA